MRFKIGGAEYEIDLSAENTAAFRQQLGPLHRTRPQGWQQTAAPAGANYR